MKKRYKIVVTEMSDEDVILPKQWDKLEDGKWGYTPEVVTHKTVEREIYTQDVDDLDLVAVISAVNQITIVT